MIVLKRILFVSMLLISQILHAIGEEGVANKYNTFKGKVINQDSIVHLANKYFPMPENLKQKVIEWIEEDNNMQLLEQLAAFPAALSLSNFKNTFDKSTLVQLGIKNLSKHNYVFEIPCAQAFIKIGGPSNRLATLIRSTGINPYDRERNKKLQEKGLIIDAIDQEIPTYQTISRMAYYLLVKEAVDKLKSEHIKIPKTYLFRLPGKPDIVSDNNYILVQERVKGIQSANANNLAQLSEEAIHHLCKIAVTTGVLWGVSYSNLGMKEENGKMIIYLTDLEQPNNSNPLKFFHGNSAKVESNVSVGNNRLDKMFLEACKQNPSEKTATNLAILRSLIKNK